METAKKSLEQVLETHFCDLDETEKHEAELYNKVETYFRFFNVKKTTQIMESLSDEKRVKILKLLSFREMCNCELTAALDTSQPNLTYHVKKLENAGLLKNRRDGKFTYYSLEDSPMVELCMKLIR